MITHGKRTINIIFDVSHFQKIIFIDTYLLPFSKLLPTQSLHLSDEDTIRNGLKNQNHCFKEIHRLFGEEIEVRCIEPIGDYVVIWRMGNLNDRISEYGKKEHEIVNILEINNNGFKK